MEGSGNCGADDGSCGGREGAGLGGGRRGAKFGGTRRDEAVARGDGDEGTVGHLGLTQRFLRRYLAVLSCF